MPINRPGEAFAEENLTLREGRDEKLIERAGLALASYGQPYHHQRDNLRQHRDDSGDNEPLGSERRIVSGAYVKNGWRRGIAMRLHPSQAETRNAGVGEPENDESRVRVAAIDDELHRSGSVRKEVPGKTAVDRQDKDDFARVDQRVDLASALQRGDLLEVTRSQELGDEIARGSAAILVINRNGHTVEEATGGDAVFQREPSAIRRPPARAEQALDPAA